MKNILHAALFELENMLAKKSTWLIAAAYTLFSLAICLSEQLRQSYFSLTESLPVTLYNFVLPYALVLILLSALSPTFAGDRERGIEQIPAACFIGKKGRARAKLIAAVLFAMIICTALVLSTLIICSVSGLTNGGVLIKNIRSEAAEVRLKPVWSAFRHIGFSAVSLTVGSVFTGLLVLFISARAKSTISAASISAVVVLFEFLINRFSFPTIMQEYNIWVFLKPYYLFGLETFNISPFVNLVILSLAFSPICVLEAWDIGRR